MRRNKTKKTRQLLLTAVFVMATMVASAQVFLMGDDNSRTGTGDLSNVITHGSENDQTNYAPMGGGSLLLAALGGAYLLKKRKK